MSYSNDLKPAKILNIPSIEELIQRIYLKREDDLLYYGSNDKDTKYKRYKFTLETSDIDIKPTIRLVKVIGRNSYSQYESFVIEPQEGCQGIAIVLIKRYDPKNVYCNIRILPFTRLNSIAIKEKSSEILTIDLKKTEANPILKTDITIHPSVTGEALFSTHEVSTEPLTGLISDEEAIHLKKDLEFHGAKIAAHFCQEILEILLNDENHRNGESTFSLSDDYILNLPTHSLKDTLVALSTIGNVAIEIVGVDAVRDIHEDWRKASEFVGYLI